MDNADTNAHLVNQGELFAQRDQPAMIFGNFAGKLNNERLSFEALNVGQCFAQKVQTQLASNFASIGHWFLLAFENGHRLTQINTDLIKISVTLAF